MTEQEIVEIVEKLEKRIASLEKEIAELKATLRVSNKKPGRKPMFSDIQKKEIYIARKNGEKEKDIAKKYHCSEKSISSIYNKMKADEEEMVIKTR